MPLGTCVNVSAQAIKKIGLLLNSPIFYIVGLDALFAIQNSPFCISYFSYRKIYRISADAGEYS